MKRACLTLGFLAASSSAAFAGGYVGLGIGTSPAINDDQDVMVSEGRSGRLLVGSRWSNFALEGAVHKFGMTSPGRQPFDFYQGSVAGKLSFPLGNGFEAFGRLGLQRSWLRNEIATFDKEGTGWLAGAGFEYRFNLAATSGSLFVDYQYNDVKLDGDRGPLQLSSRMWTLGATIGF